MFLLLLLTRSVKRIPQNNPSMGRQEQVLAVAPATAWEDTEWRAMSNQTAGTPAYSLVLSWQVIGRPPHGVSCQWPVVVHYSMQQALTCQADFWRQLGSPAQQQQGAGSNPRCDTSEGLVSIPQNQNQCRSSVKCARVSVNRHSGKWTHKLFEASNS